MANFAERLQQARKEKGVTQKQISDEFGITTRAYGFWEHGGREPTIDTLKKLADYFDVTLDWLTGRSDVR